MKPESAGGYFFAGLAYLVMIAVATVILSICAFGTAQLFSSHPVESRHVTLTSLRDKDGVEGLFYLGSGTISTQPYYFYYERLPDGSVRPGKVSSDRSIKIFEEDRGDASMVVYNWYIDYPLWAWLICIPDTDATSHSYDFHVPRGTVRAGYSM